jgi:hypothetical protein
MTPAWEHERQRSESGMVMVIVLGFILILSLITVALGNLAASEYATARTLDSGTQAFLTAEAGAERAIALLRPLRDWSASAGGGGWKALYVNAPFPDPGSGGPAIGQFSVSLQPVPNVDPATNVIIQSIGRVRGATRTIRFTLHRATGADVAIYSIQDVNTAAISGGGHLQWHGSAYFESNLALKGGSQAGIYNDRKVFSTDQGFLNHLYVRGDLDVSTGNPVIGSPYWWVHVQGATVGSDRNLDPVNQDHLVPPPYYPDVLGAVRSTLNNPGNLLTLVAGQERLVVCSLIGGSWQPQTSPTPDLDLSATGGAFILPRQDKTCASFNGPPVMSIGAVRATDGFMLLWDPQSSGSNLVLNNAHLPIYIPGQVHVSQNVVYAGKGTIVIANDPSLTPSAQTSCALDFDGTGCAGTPSAGNTFKASVSPCQGAPGVDNPATTFPTSDLAAFVVNGGAYANLGGNACAQEMDLVAIIGDRHSGASVDIQKKLQWYGLLMARTFGLGQVPDFWQMPDLMNNLPAPLKGILNGNGQPVQIHNWGELF